MKAARSVFSIADALGRLSEKWLEKSFRFRRLAVAGLVKKSGFSENMSQAILDAVFSQCTRKKLRHLLKSEFRDPAALDRFRPDPRSGKALLAKGPAKILHIFAANSPQAAVQSLICGLLLKSVNIGKLSRRDSGFLAQYVASLKKTDASLGRCCRLLNPKDSKALEREINTAGLVAAYGTDETLDAVRKQVPGRTLFFGYGHKISLSFFTKTALTGRNAARLARRAARDVWMADQRGCLSPAIIYAEAGADITAKSFAALLARELKRLAAEKNGPRRTLGHHAGLRRFAERARLLKVRGKDSAFWQSEPPGRWAVVYEGSGRSLLPGAGQLIQVKAFRRSEVVFQELETFRGYLQGVALEAGPDEKKRLASRFAELGASRVCRAGALQQPPLTWHHDGLSPLASWVRWTDWEDNC